MNEHGEEGEEMASTGTRERGLYVRNLSNILLSIPMHLTDSSLLTTPVKINKGVNY